MNIEDLEILKELSEQTYFGDLPFLYYADLIDKLLTAYEKEKETSHYNQSQLDIANAKLVEEKEKNKELEEKIIHRYKRICPECNNSFIAKRNDTKYCQKCGKKVARRKYKEANKEKIREYSKLHMRKYRAKKKLLKEE